MCNLCQAPHLTLSCQAKMIEKGQEKVKDQCTVLQRLDWISKGRLAMLSHALQVSMRMCERECY